MFFLQTTRLVRFVPKRQLLKVLHILRVSSLPLEVSIGEVKVVKETEENQPFEELEVTMPSNAYERAIVKQLVLKCLIADVLFSAHIAAFQ